MKKAVLILTLAIMLGAAGDAFCQFSLGQDTLRVPSPTSYAPSMFGLIFKLVLSLGLIIGLIYLSTYFLRKLNMRGSTGEVGGGSIKVMGRTFIGPKQCLYVVKIGDKYSVLGATESNINFITDLKKEDADKYAAEPQKVVESSPFAKFSDILKGKMKP
jgi:flagellar biosynthetic protein FliO